jgi:hypothetical protein
MSKYSARELLIPAARQYAHNNKQGSLFPGYDYEETRKIVDELLEENRRMKQILIRISDSLLEV